MYITENKILLVKSTLIWSLYIWMRNMGMNTDSEFKIN